MTSKYFTALRDHVRKQIEDLGYADIVVGIPSYYSGSTIVHVIQMVAEGLKKYFGRQRAVVIVSDGGSTDDTREMANLVALNSFDIEKIVTIYRGVPGKGSGLRAVFEVAKFLGASAVAVFDSDLHSIRPEWVRNLLAPIRDGYDYVTPEYKRYKLDGTITNTIVYNLTRALYGVKIRQPIGGDFGISAALVRHYLDQEVWETDVARYGIDIWMTLTAVVGGFKICQARMGAKIHGQKDPVADLGPMFRQVVGTIYGLMDQHEAFWRQVKGSGDIPTVGEYVGQDPSPFDIDQQSLIDYFRMGFRNFGGVWSNVIEPADYETVEKMAHCANDNDLRFPIDTWARIVYRYAVAFHLTSRQRIKILNTLIPLYNARVASLINEVAGMEPEESERHFESQARVFEENKEYLLRYWDKRKEDAYGGLLSERDGCNPSMA